LEKNDVSPETRKTVSFTLLIRRTWLADIFQDLPIKVPPDRVFAAISTPTGLDKWWTKRSTGTPAPGSVYELWFGSEYDWRARVIRFTPPTEFEFEMTRADEDWTGSRVAFSVVPLTLPTGIRRACLIEPHALRSPLGASAPFSFQNGRRDEAASCENVEMVHSIPRPHDCYRGERAINTRGRQGKRSALHPARRRQRRHHHQLQQ
jgi:uncharacterized protein YndB with AHSA1/START domain